MLKTINLMKDIEKQAAPAIRHILEQVPAITQLEITFPSQEPNEGVDLMASFKVAGRSHSLACSVKSATQPRYIRTALAAIRANKLFHAAATTSVLITPYFSHEAQALCREQEVGFMDLEGNARLTFDSVFIERQVASKPAAKRRELKSLFRPKSSMVLRAMLRKPDRCWRMTELAQAARVSLGHVSNVRVGLLDREWAKVSDEGLCLSAPDALLDAWRAVYEPPAGKTLAFYTTLHGAAFEEAARGVMAELGTPPKAAFSSFSAAHWLAPYGRTGTQYFYATELGLERLKTALTLTKSAKGENVRVTVLEESSLLNDILEPAPKAICTSLVQTYLDLTHAGERGMEAAEHLRQDKLTWPR